MQALRTRYFSNLYLDCKILFRVLASTDGKRLPANILKDVFGVDTMCPLSVLEL